MHEFWRSEKGLHINIKELKASIAAVKSLAKPGETVFLTIDNQVAYSYLKRGGKVVTLQHLNETIALALSSNHMHDLPNRIGSCILTSHFDRHRITRKKRRHARQNRTVPTS